MCAHAPGVPVCRAAGTALFPWTGLRAGHREVASFCCLGAWVENIVEGSGHKKAAVLHQPACGLDVARFIPGIRFEKIPPGG